MDISEKKINLVPSDFFANEADIPESPASFL